MRRLGLGFALGLAAVAAAAAAPRPVELPVPDLPVTVNWVRLALTRPPLELPSAPPVTPPEAEIDRAPLPRFITALPKPRPAAADPGGFSCAFIAFRRAAALAECGVHRILTGDPKGAREALEESVAIDPRGSQAAAAHVWLGELYVGSNLTDIGGGIGQGVNTMTGRTVKGFGGWLEAAVVPTARHMLAVGASGDFVNPDDISMGERERNGTVYGVLRYKPKTTLQLGAEYLYWRTVYRGMSDGVANRFNFHLSVFF